MNFAFAELDTPVHLRVDRPFTDEELLRFCRENELLRVERDENGELVFMSPCGTEGGGIELDVATELNNWAWQDGRGKALGPNSGVKLPDTSVRAADAAWISWDRYNAGVAGRTQGLRPCCPEFVIEVRSEGDRLQPLHEKMAMWLSNGAELGWLIDPSRKAVEIYRPGREPEVQEGHSAVYGEGAVAGLVLELGKIWVELRDLCCRSTRRTWQQCGHGVSGMQFSICCFRISG
jgi:Uma2 family endonuclease